MGNKIETLTKHTALIHASGKLSLVERKLNNVLLKHAFNDLEEKEIHTIEVSKLRRLYGMSKDYNDRHLERSLRNIGKKTIEFNMFQQDKQNSRVWSFIHFLSECNIDFKNGICTYAYPPTMRKILKNPNLYARLNMEVQREFSSRYAIALWEYLEEHQCRTYEKLLYTSWVPLQDFKRLCGVSVGLYNQFKHFNDKVIKLQVKEVNKVSGLNVEVEYKKQAKKVIALRFKVSRKENFKYQKSLDGLSPYETFDVKEETISKLSEDYQVSKSIATSLAKSYSLEQIEKNLKFVDEQVEKSDIRNVGAFTKMVIEQDLKLKQTKFDRKKKQKDLELEEQSHKTIKAEKEKKMIEEEADKLARAEWQDYTKERKSDLLKKKRKEYPMPSLNDKAIELLVINDIRKKQEEKRN